MFHRYIASVTYECCNGCTRMLQTSVPNVSSVFLIRMLQVCLFRYYIYFIYMLQVFYLNVVYKCFFRCFCKRFRCMFQCFGRQEKVKVRGSKLCFRKILPRMSDSRSVYAVRTKRIGAELFSPVGPELKANSSQPSGLFGFGFTNNLIHNSVSS
jgi:hypothetical protein